MEEDFEKSRCGQAVVLKIMRLFSRGILVGSGAAAVTTMTYGLVIQNPGMIIPACIDFGICATAMCVSLSVSRRLTSLRRQPRVGVDRRSPT